MTDFTAADHVSEREIVGTWIDCTPASVLETLRLALPNGRKIPTSMKEVDRLRAAAGAGPEGVTIDQVAEGAEKLYGLTDADYVITDDWKVVLSFLEDPFVVMAVQGMMGNFPPTVRRWDTYAGPHAVAKHDIRVMCDPLAPTGRYIGEEVNLSGWWAFFTGLSGAKAFAMRITGGAKSMLQLPEGITSPQIVKIIKGGDLLLTPGGKRIASVPVGRKYPYLGTTPGYKAVLVHTPLAYDDGKSRPTQLYVHSDMAVIENAPPSPTPGISTVVLSIDGVPVYSSATS